jgi:hypothetical protein
MASLQRHLNGPRSPILSPEYQEAWQRHERVSTDARKGRPSTGAAAGSSGAAGARRQPAAPAFTLFGGLFGGAKGGKAAGFHARTGGQAAIKRLLHGARSLDMGPALPLTLQGGCRQQISRHFVCRPLSAAPCLPPPHILWDLPPFTRPPQAPR